MGVNRKWTVEDFRLSEEQDNIFKMQELLFNVRVKINSAMQITYNTTVSELCDMGGWLDETDESLVRLENKLLDLEEKINKEMNNNEKEEK